MSYFSRYTKHIERSNSSMNIRKNLNPNRFWVIIRYFIVNIENQSPCALTFCQPMLFIASILRYKKLKSHGRE